MSGQLKSLEELADILKISRMKKDLKTHPDTLKKKFENPGLFLFEDATKLAALLEVDEKLIVDLIYAEGKSKRKKR